MKMNNKGFAVTGILYTILIIFMVSMVTLLFNLQNRKTILDELKADAVDAVESDNNYEYLLNEINALKAQIGTTDISSVGDGTITGSIYNLSEMDFLKVQSTDVGVTNTYANFIKELHDSLNDYENFVGIVSGTSAYSPIFGIKHNANEGIYIRVPIYGDGVVIYSFRGNTDSMYIRTSFEGPSTQYTKS